MQIIQSRRDFLASPSLAGAAGVAWRPAHRSLTRDRSETTTIRLVQDLRHLRRADLHCRGAAARGGLHRYPLCGRAGGRRLGGDGRAGRGRISLLTFAAPLLIPTGCRRAAHRHRRARMSGASSCSRTTPSARIADLKGKSVGVQALGSSQHVFLASMASLRRARPAARTSTGSRSPSAKPKELFAEGKIDAFLGFPPEPQEMRASNIGHVIVNSA